MRESIRGVGKEMAQSNLWCYRSETQRSATELSGGPRTRAFSSANILLSCCLGGLILRKLSDFLAASNFLNHIRRKRREGRDGREREESPCRVSIRLLGVSGCL